jgi:hypothetical protein
VPVPTTKFKEKSCKMFKKKNKERKKGAMKNE